ncbi:class I SAM-dependent methyltransferase [Halovulum sp. GXIMD14793]
MTADPETLAFYDQNAETYAAFSDREDFRRLTDFIALMPEAAVVLDLGCGIGWAAAAMQKAGLTAEALDASAGLAGIAAERFGLSVTVAPFAALTAVACYDGIWANFSLQHADRAERPALFHAMWTALKPGGWLVAGAHRGDGPYRDTHGRLYVPFTRAELDDLLQDFEQVSLTTGHGTGFDGREMAYWHISACKQT